MNVALNRLSVPRRLLLAVVGVLGLMSLVRARNLEPDSRGFGTHEQLGLAPCYFQELTGNVCPLCGGTTAWARVMHGELVEAANANFGGMLLCVVVVVGSPWLLIVAVKGRGLKIRPSLRTLLVIASAWLAVVVLDWLRRIYFS